MPNDNHLEGLACPICGNNKALYVAVESIVLMRDDGHDYTEGQHTDWNEHSWCKCPTCEYTATVMCFDWDNHSSARKERARDLVRSLQKERGPTFTHQVFIQSWVDDGGWYVLSKSGVPRARECKQMWEEAVDHAHEVWRDNFALERAQELKDRDDARPTNNPVIAPPMDLNYWLDQTSADADAFANKYAALLVCHALGDLT